MGKMGSLNWKYYIISVLVEYIGPAGYDNDGCLMDNTPNTMIQIDNTTDSYSDDPSDEDNIPTIDTEGNHLQVMYGDETSMSTLTRLSIYKEKHK